MYLDPVLIYISLWIDCLFEIRKIAVFLLAFIAGWLQGHWWGFISRNYVVWSTFLLMNVFIALKGSDYWLLLYALIIVCLKDFFPLTIVCFNLIFIIYIKFLIYSFALCSTRYVHVALLLIEQEVSLWSILQSHRVFCNILSQCSLYICIYWCVVVKALHGGPHGGMAF